MISNDWLIVIGFIGFAFGLVLMQRQLAQQNKRLNQQQKLLDDYEMQQGLLKQEIQELRSGTLGVGRRLQELQQGIVEQQQQLEEVSQQDPQAKLYARASKMVALGASLDEIIAECEIPRAEAELLLRLNQANSE
ncbi:DUF2802 domain-containing protein [Paraferrimonas sedimenticola]|uniref:DUF2802 domain-containing protein n=1 Tax=Paraferrimonas sedimenticola TaxID=375674 RepID=A0AA37RU91_9GAMM|nr:DUF2802 domain-containing protein [Paraferrimonas sedimenticola]GLP94949.1 DUF2802 domain-containing protein [Paraferrimonas sedimenticola]